MCVSVFFFFFGGGRDCITRKRDWYAYNLYGIGGSGGEITKEPEHFALTDHRECFKSQGTDKFYTTTYHRELDLVITDHR